MKSLDTVRLRKLIGWLGMFLAWIVLILSLINGFGFPPSISATYFYAPCITPFMIILGSAGFLLVCYRGYTKGDDIVNTLTGIAALCICLFPCAATSLLYVGTFMVPTAISGIIHNISAVIFFGLLAYNSFFLFTKSNAVKMTKNKKRRNIIYRICGIGMILSFAILLLPTFSCQIWVVEMIGLTFFGISFLTKADVYPWLFCDSPDQDKDTDNA